MIINHNLPALNAIRNYQKNTQQVAKDLAKLSSGLRINCAADDSAGLAISEKMRAQIRGTNQALRNAEDGISALDTADGGMEAVESILHRMREMCVEAANDTATDEDRLSIQKELDQLRQGISSIASDTEFNTIKVLNGIITTPTPAPATTDRILTPITISIDYNTLTVPGVTSIDVGGYMVDFEIEDVGTDVLITALHKGVVIGTAKATPGPTVSGVTFEWLRSYGGINPDIGESLAATDDGGFILAGWSYSTTTPGHHGNDEGWVIKTDADGVIEWEKAFGSTQGFEYFSQIIPTSDGGYIALGGTSGLAPGIGMEGDIDLSEVHGGMDIWVVKMDADGNIQWQHPFGGSLNDTNGGTPGLMGVKMLQDDTGTGNYIITACTNSVDGDLQGTGTGSRQWILQIDSYGKILSSAILPHASTSPEIVSTSMGGFVTGGNVNAIVYKFDDNLDLSKFTAIDLTATNIGSIQSLYGTTDGGFLASGANGMVVKVDISGNVEWNVQLSGDIYAMVENKFGDYIMSGTNSNGAFLVKIDENGNIIWQETNTGSVNALDVITLSDGRIVMYGYDNSNGINGALTSYYDKSFDNGNDNGVVPIDLDNIIDGSKTLRFRSARFYFDSGDLNEVEKIVINALLTDATPAQPVQNQGNFILHIGANTNQELFITLPNMNLDNIGLAGGQPQAVTRAQADASLNILDSSMSTVSTERARLGAIKNRLEYIVGNAGNYSGNLSASESRVRDLEMSGQMAQYAKNKIILESSMAMTAQTNNMAQNILTLLR